MAGRPGRSGRRRQDFSSPLVDLDRVFADDRFIDSIAASPWGAAERLTVAAGSPNRGAAGAPREDLTGADPLTDLFETWRDELASTPMPTLVSLHSTLATHAPAKPSAKRSLRPALSIAAAIAALLIGTATVGSKDAQPGSALWAVTQLVWPDRVASVNSKDDVQKAITEADAAIKDGRSRDAQLALIKASVALGKVSEVDGLGDMTKKVNDLWARATPPDQTTSVIPDPSSDVTLSTPGSSTPPSINSPTVLVPPPVTPPSTSDVPPADLAGGLAGGQAQPPVAVQQPIVAAAAPVIPSSSDSVPVAAAPSSSNPVPASPVPTPASTDPAADQTTSLPPPIPVDPPAQPSPAPSTSQSAPENSAPSPPPAQSSPATDSTTASVATGSTLFSSTDTTAGSAP